MTCNEFYRSDTIFIPNTTYVTGNMANSTYQSIKYGLNIIWHHIFHTSSHLDLYMSYLFCCTDTKFHSIVSAYATKRDIWLSDKQNKIRKMMLHAFGYQCRHYVLILFFAVVGLLRSKAGGWKYRWCWNVIWSKVYRYRIFLWWSTLSGAVLLCRYK